MVFYQCVLVNNYLPQKHIDIKQGSPLLSPHILCYTNQV